MVYVKLIAVLCTLDPPDRDLGECRRSLMYRSVIPLVTSIDALHLTDSSRSSRNPPPSPA